MSLSRVDFAAIAQVLGAARADASSEQEFNMIEKIEDGLVRFCKRHNPEFDAARFREAARAKP